jgi:hypothetical protein
MMITLWDIDANPSTNIAQYCHSLACLYAIRGEAAIAFNNHLVREAALASA